MDKSIKKSPNMPYAKPTNQDSVFTSPDRINQSDRVM